MHQPFSLGRTYVPGEPISIPVDWRGVYATGKVVDIRPLARSGMKEVVVQVTEGLVNAETGRTITFYTAADDGACGYRFLRGRNYVIESYLLRFQRRPLVYGSAER